MGTKITNNQVDTKFNQINKAFTALGEDAPLIKIKKITGVSPVFSSGATYPHGLNKDKILSFSILIESSSGVLTPPGEPFNNVSYSATVDSTNLVINSVEDLTLAERPFRAIFIYEE